MDCKLEYAIRYNHVGYGVNERNVFFFAADPATMQAPAKFGFRIVGMDGAVALEGTLLIRGNCDYTAETVYEGDFSALTVPGTYRILVLVSGEVVKESHAFEISDKLFLRELRANIKSFYFQRSGVELPTEYAGKWARPAAHADNDLAFHSMMNRPGVWNAHGGWYDAGDYGKYIVNGGVSVATLLLACEMCPSAVGIMGGDGFVPTFEQPCSLLDEIRFELEFFLRMQDSDGGVFFKVTPGHWDGFMMPEDSDVMQKRFIMGKSTTSTLNFAGALAQAHHVFKMAGGAANEAFAENCLAASIRAYEWALQNPDVGWPRNTEGSGGYGDERYDDEFFWARAMLFRELRDGSALAGDIVAELPADMDRNPVQLSLDWRDTQNLGWIALALNDDDGPVAKEFREKARIRIAEAAESILNLQKDDAYAISIRRFIWGSNGEIANHALTLMVAYSWTRDVRFRAGAKELVDFIYGRNPLNVCFVTGAAWSSPRFPHHRISHADGVVDPVPGLLVGGINNDRQDMHRKPHYSSELPGFAYTDERCSFASNETAINWNAPLTAVLALLNCL